MKTLGESPSGIVHLVSLNGRNARTRCGTSVNGETWTRIRQFDQWMYGKTRASIREKIELPTCDRCFG